MANKNEHNSVVKYHCTSLSRVKKQLSITNKILKRIEPKAKEILIFDYEHLGEFYVELFNYFFPSTKFNFHLPETVDELLYIFKKNDGNFDLIQLNHSTFTFNGTDSSCTIDEFLNIIKDDYFDINIIVISTWGKDFHYDYLEDLKKKHLIKEYLFRTLESEIKEYIKKIKLLLGL